MAAGEAGGSRLQMASVPCRFYAKGDCRRGDACWFKHEVVASGSQATPKSPVLNVTPLQAAAPAFTPSSNSATSPSTLDVTMVSPTPSTSQLPQEEEEERVCVICFDVPKSFGLLESCAHVYCLTCIRDWRTEKGKTTEQIEGDVLQRCPACRAFSKNVIPSEWWIPEGAGKKSYIASYKERMGKIPCRNFVNSPPDAKFCPFGKDCFYQHLQEDGSPYIFEHGMADHIIASRRQRDQRQLERHLRDFYTRWRTGELDGLDYGDEDDMEEDEDEDEFSDEWDDVDEDDEAMDEDEEIDENENEEDEEDSDDEDGDSEDDDEEFQEMVREAMRQSVLEQERVAQLAGAQTAHPSNNMSAAAVGTASREQSESIVPATRQQVTVSQEARASELAESLAFIDRTIAQTEANDYMSDERRNNTLRLLQTQRRLIQVNMREVEQEIRGTALGRRMAQPTPEDRGSSNRPGAGIRLPPRSARAQQAIQEPEQELEGLRQQLNRIAAHATREQARATADQRAIDNHSDIAIEPPRRLPRAVSRQIPQGLAAALSSSFTGRGRYMPSQDVLALRDIARPSDAGPAASRSGNGGLANQRSDGGGRRNRNRAQAEAAHNAVSELARQSAVAADDDEDIPGLETLR